MEILTGKVLGLCLWSCSDSFFLEKMTFCVLFMYFMLAGLLVQYNLQGFSVLLYNHIEGRVSTIVDLSEGDEKIIGR